MDFAADGRARKGGGIMKNAPDQTAIESAPHKRHSTPQANGEQRTEDPAPTLWQRAIADMRGCDPSEVPRFAFISAGERLPAWYYTESALQAVDLAEARCFLEQAAPGQTEFVFKTFTEYEDLRESALPQFTKTLRGTLDKDAGRLALLNDNYCGIFVEIDGISVRLPGFREGDKSCRFITKVEVLS